MAAINWEGSFEFVVEAPVEKVWEAASDFAGWEKWAKRMVMRLEVVEGEPNTVGCLRKVYSQPPPPVQVTGDGNQLVCVHERLVAVDPSTHTFSYKLEEGTHPVLLASPGFHFVATFHLDQDESGCKSKITWSYQCSPFVGFTPESYQHFVRGFLDIFVADLKAYLAAEG